MSEPLQFDRAQGGQGMACTRCHKPITTVYYEIARKVFCSDCARQLVHHFAPDASAGGLSRAALFGVGGALLGAAIYYAVLAATGYEIGLIAIVVGFLVGWAVQKGSRGKRGRSYQLLAVALTYLAIGGTYVPLVVKGLRDRETTRVAAADSAAATDSSGVAALVKARRDSAESVADSAARANPGRHMALRIVVLIALAAVMPLLASFANLPASLISALIIGFALRQAWRMNAVIRVKATGPFKVQAGPAAAPGGAT